MQSAQASRKLPRRFYVLWTGQLVSQFGDYLAYLAVPWFIVELIGVLSEQAASGQLGIWYALDSAPTMVIGLFGGVLIDRMRLRGLMVFSDVARAIAFGLLAFAAAGDFHDNAQRLLMMVFGLAFVVGSFSTLFSSALFTLVPRLVGNDRLAIANARLITAENTAHAGAPLVAAQLVTAVGFWATFLLNALTYLASAVSITLVGPVARQLAPRSSKSVLSEMASGLRFVWNEKRLRITTLASSVFNLVIGFVEATFVLIAREMLGVPDSDMGIFYASLGVGAIVGSLLAFRVITWLGLGRTFVLGGLVTGSAWASLATSAWGTRAVVSAGLFMGSIALVNIASLTIRQRYTPDPMLGRVLTATRGIAWASLPIGALIGTWTADRFGRFDDMVVGASLVILVTCLAIIPTVIWRDTFGGTDLIPIPDPAENL